ncbi:hypothetical protein BT93_K2223 [Corymbia citriodora subsp. variegata]|nr:hypothetical protein BT93_K2223 [Corymbia citriodora subsp. variegata]
MIGNNTIISNPPLVPPPSDPFPDCLENNGNTTNKRKRRPAGTPDPDAEVVSLSPKTLLESDRYVCEICNQGFQRDQNLQMHRRRHKVPWKLLKRETPAVRKRVFVCPEPSCLHHDPGHALGDLVGIKKHFRRKHSNHKQWVCERCSKGYAVQSDYKAHLKTCGTRGHSCDCGRVFSRVESFIEHQDTCNMGRLGSDSHNNNLQPPCLSRTASSPSPSSDTNLNTPSWPTTRALAMPKPAKDANIFSNPIVNKPSSKKDHHDDFHNLELQLSTSSNPTETISANRPNRDEKFPPHLQLSMSSSCADCACERNGDGSRDQLTHQLRMALAEKAYADEARQAARRQIEQAEREFANAKRMRQQAQAELDKAHALKEHARKKMSSAILQITCQVCKQKLQARELLRLAPDHESSLALSYMSSAITEGEVDNDINRVC